MSLFLESKYTGKQDHSASFLAEGMSQVIKATPGSIGGAIMDNTLANKSAWELLKTEHPGMFFQGCVSHGLHLFVSDIFSATKKKCGHLVADYPEGYPFKYILDFVHECKNVNILPQPSGFKGTAESDVEGCQVEDAGMDGTYLLGFNQNNGRDHAGS
jgi:Protein of unknown function (DUF 659)